MIQLFADAPVLLESTQDFLASIVAFVVLFIPLLLIPFSFKLAGGLVGRINQLLGGYGSKITEAVKGNPANPDSLRYRMMRKSRDVRTMRQYEAMNAGSQPGAGVFKRARGGFILKSGLFGNVEGKMADIHDEASKRRERQSSNMDDATIFAGGGWMLRPGEAVSPEMAAVIKDTDGNAIAAGTATPYARYFNSKGAQISKLMYDRGQRWHAQTGADVGENISYAIYKTQKDVGRGAARLAYARNKMARGWSDDQGKLVWAKATYGRKDIDMTQWYSNPVEITDPATGQKSVVFEDVADYQYDEAVDKTPGNMPYVPGTHEPANPAKAKPRSALNMASEMNHDRAQFELTKDKDAGVRTLYEWQRRLEDKALAGKALSTHEQQLLVYSYQFFDTMGQRLAGAAVDDTGQAIGPVSAGGGTAASVETIKTALESRRFDIGALQQDGSREIYAIPPPSGGAPARTTGMRIPGAPPVGATVVAKGMGTGGDLYRSTVPREVQG